MEKEVLAAGFTPKIVLVYNIHTHTHTHTQAHTHTHLNMDALSGPPP